MSNLVRELLQHILPRLIGERMLFGATLIWIGFWFLDYAIERTRAQPTYSVIMVVVAMALCSVGIGMVTTLGSMLGALAIGFFCYLPMFIGRRRRRTRVSE